MKGKKLEAGEEQGWGKGRWEGEGEGRRISCFEGLFQQKKVKVRGDGNLWKVERRDELKEENLCFHISPLLGEEKLVSG